MTYRFVIFPILFFLACGLFFAGPVLSAEGLKQQRKALAGFQIIGHRGASGYAPEHTWASYDRALAMDVDYLEIDLHMTADGKLVAIHDQTLYRTTDGQGLVKDRTLAELKRLDAGSWFNRVHPEYASDDFVGETLLTLEEIIGRYGQSTRYYIETKSPKHYPEMQKALLDVLESKGLIESGCVIIQSFSRESLEEVHELNPNVPLVQLLWYSRSWDSQKQDGEVSETPSWSNDAHTDFEAIAEYAVGVGVNYRFNGERVINLDFVSRAHDHGLLVHAYTINKPVGMRRLIGWGVDGIFTNFPDVLSDIAR